MRAKDALGRFGEDVAVRHLQHDGFTVLERNWRCALGEVDIVARDGDVLVICEVKTRRSVRFGTPLEAVTPAKARRLRRLAAQWMHDNGTRSGSIRIDVVGVLADGIGPVRVQHVKGVD